jgi:hypothetical protein
MDTTITYKASNSLHAVMCERALCRPVAKIQIHHCECDLDACVRLGPPPVRNVELLCVRADGLEHRLLRLGPSSNPLCHVFHTGGSGRLSSVLEHEMKHVSNVMKMLE